MRKRFSCYLGFMEEKREELKMRSRKKIVLISIAIMLMIFLVGGVSSSVALAKKPAGMDTNLSASLINAARAYGQAKLFWAAAEYFNSMGYSIELTDLQDELDAALYHLNWALQLAGTDPTASMEHARISKELSEFVKNNIEERIHAEGRSVGEYKKSDCEGALIFGWDVVMCAATAAHLESHGIPTEVVLDKPLQYVDLRKFAVIFLDPEYSYYRGWYGGLSPQDNAYLANAVAAGKIGLVYMEPYSNGGDLYTRYGQLSFLPINFNGSWVMDGTWNVADPGHPLAADLPSSFYVGSYGQWDSLGLMPNPKVSNAQVVANDVGPTILGFNYGKGKGVVLAADTFWTMVDDANWGLLLRNCYNWSTPAE